MNIADLMLIIFSLFILEAFNKSPACYNLRTRLFFKEIFQYPRYCCKLYSKLYYIIFCPFSKYLYWKDTKWHPWYKISCRSVALGLKKKLDGQPQVVHSNFFQTGSYRMTWCHPSKFFFTKSCRPAAGIRLEK